MPASRSETFVYDQLGNRKGANTLDARGSVTFARRDTGLNQYASWTPPMAATNYDTNGVLTSEGWLTGTYNALNQPVTISSASASVSFGYDPLGRCVKRASSTTTYLYYHGWNLIQEGANYSSANRIYVHGNRVDEIVADQASGVWNYHHYDARGHCILLTDASGNLVEQYSYDAFGKVYYYDGAGNALTDSARGNRFLFTGREWLSTLRLYDYRNRHYLPELGRFIQPDPKEFDAGDYNLYRYCHNDPVNHSDPTGLFMVMSMGEAMIRYCDGQMNADQFKQGVARAAFLKALSNGNLTFGQISKGGSGDGTVTEQVTRTQATAAMDHSADWAAAHRKEVAGIIDPKGKSVEGPEDRRGSLSSDPGIKPDSAATWHLHLLGMPGAVKGGEYQFSHNLFGSSDSNLLRDHPDIPHYVGVLDGPPGKFTIFGYLSKDQPFVWIRVNYGVTPGFNHP